ncbi:SMI1/KNR4 family protein [Kitasatospora sp. NPDC092039]|uniref:SMI1/KNR4 family protein n=1 Tax=Kitasatospora sp. NPDC092039 TaxID=3364086 RepID=UPI003811620A
MATLDEIKALLGAPGFHWSDPAPWARLERELGVSLPADFREFTDAYGPVEINEQLYLEHPGHPVRNLGEKIREWIEHWSDEDDAEFLPAPAGSGPGELLPVATATTGEFVFLRVPDGPSAPWGMGVLETDTLEYVPYDELAFGDWLLAYLRGEDVTVHSHNFAPDQPFYRPLT